ncbi:peptidoglycan-associated lipoprotein Pal [Gammaproteobacteria bacterium]|nr:peptidoglycan-associated lipoprotein Pal [Gammaproteobacteria bacterium]MDC0442811.1 peptidoglycan-associated lipoprotein Pal [Gammaproteobacteria bacterium]|tara:strand:- start:3584 stop:4057 length:474 start_codon:yes stop_codon:yes gene_type:complete
MSKSINSLFTIFTLIIFTACSSVQVTEEAVADQSVAGVSITQKSTATQAVLANAVVYFEYDQFNLTAKSIQALKGVTELMKRNAKITISIEGHADERGTREYNLALGQRRSESVANYLVANGINRNRLITKSYGEERPLSLGSNDTAWSKNRRVEIK